MPVPLPGADARTTPPDHDEVVAKARAVVTAVRGTGTLTDTQRYLLCASFEAMSGVHLDVDELEPLGPADFAEWIPLDARFSDGTDGGTRHNLFPEAWQRLSREVMDELRPGDGAVFSRSGWTGVQSVSQIHWTGDQETGFEAEDGDRKSTRLNSSHT